MKLSTLTKATVALTVVLMGFSASIASAQNQLTTNVTIDRMINWGSGGGEALFIITNEPIVNPNSCEKDTRYVLTDQTSEISRSMLLGAKLANTPVKLIISGASYSSNYPAIIAVELPES